MKAYFPILISAVLFASCSKSTDSVDVQDLDKQFLSAWNSKDSSKVIGMLADDVNFLQGEIQLKGKPEVAKRWVQATITTVSDLKTNVVSTDADTHSAYEAGTFSIDVLPEGPGQPAGYGEGNFTLLWKKAADNTWKLSFVQLEDLPVQRRN